MTSGEITRKDLSIRETLAVLGIDIDVRLCEGMNDDLS